MNYPFRIQSTLQNPPSEEPFTSSVRLPFSSFRHPLLCLLTHWDTGPRFSIKPRAGLWRYTDKSCSALPLRRPIQPKPDTWVLAGSSRNGKLLFLFGVKLQRMRRGQGRNHGDPQHGKKKKKPGLQGAEEGSLGGGEVEGTMRPGSKAVRATEQNCLKLLPPRYDY